MTQYQIKCGGLVKGIIKIITIFPLFGHETQIMLFALTNKYSSCLGSERFFFQQQKMENMLKQAISHCKKIYKVLG